MCIKLGAKIEVSEEAKNLATLHEQKMQEMWQVVMQASAMIRKQNDDFWTAIRKLHPEFDNYELSYSGDSLIVLKEK